MILNYMGSKARLIPTLDKVISPLIKKIHDEKKSVVFGDLFAGTGFVGNFYMKNPLVTKLISADLELYSYVINKAMLTTVYTPKLRRILEWLNSNKLKPVKGLVWKYFSPAGGRMFFTLKNAMRIDGFRIAISALYKKKIVNYKEFIFLLASLMAACSRGANVASCFRAYLKKFCDRSLKDLIVKPIHLLQSRPRKQTRMYKNDILNVVALSKNTVDIAYLDPPYNANHYGGYYSFYNYLAVYNRRYKIGGVAGVTSLYNKSEFGFKATALQAFEKLMKLLASNGTRYAVMSYNNDGAISKDELVDMLETVGRVMIYKCWNKKFKTHQLVKSSHVKEFIFVVDFKSAAANQGTIENWI